MACRVVIEKVGKPPYSLLLTFKGKVVRERTPECGVSMESVCDCRSSGLTLPLLISAQKRCLGFPYGINSDLLTIVVVKPRGPLSFKFYSCAPKAQGCWVW